MFSSLTAAAPEGERGHLSFFESIIKKNKKYWSLKVRRTAEENEDLIWRAAQKKIDTFNMSELKG